VGVLTAAGFTGGTGVSAGFLGHMFRGDSPNGAFGACCTDSSQAGAEAEAGGQESRLPPSVACALERAMASRISSGSRAKGGPHYCGSPQVPSGS